MKRAGIYRIILGLKNLLLNPLPSLCVGGCCSCFLFCFYLIVMPFIYFPHDPFQVPQPLPEG